MKLRNVTFHDCFGRGGSPPHTRIGGFKARLPWAIAQALGPPSHILVARLADIYHADFSDDDRGTIRDQLETYEDVQSLAMKMVQTEKHLVFPLVYKLIELALILPVSTASVERAFSAMKIIKSKLRNKINDVWFNDLMGIDAPVSIVWSIVWSFDSPQAYKHFAKSCHDILGDDDVGTFHEVHVISGLLAVVSIEHLDILSDDRHIIDFSMVGGDHRLSNDRSVTTLYPCSAVGTVVVKPDTKKK
ncbi:Abscisic acid receptor PYL4 [Glycine soja]|uniref:Abscisic acid receptor PYL4 n=1 Tax=Glycine soja TaxID=3848 RepID=A0A445K183_GLYSO|nr:Abscisic acid receptor PYL4 [Glycine soja]